MISMKRIETIKLYPTPRQSATLDVNAARMILKRAQWAPLGSCAALADGEDPGTVLSSSGPRLTSLDATRGRRLRNER